jgi:hypothetical protein
MKYEDDLSEVELFELELSQAYAAEEHERKRTNLYAVLTVLLLLLSPLLLWAWPVVAPVAFVGCMIASSRRTSIK